MPALGGLVIAATDTWVLFFLSALGFVTMLVVMTSLPPQPAGTGHGTPWQQMKEGIRFIRHQPLFRWLILLTFIGMFFSQSYIQIMPAFADLLGGGEAAFGYLLSAGGVGSVMGTLLVGSIQGHRHLGRLMLGGAILAAVATSLFGMLATSGIFLLGLVTAFLAAAFASVFLISSMSVMQLSVPDALRGRVMGIHAMGFSLMPLGGLFIGVLAETLGAPGAVVLGSCIYLFCIVGVAVYQPFIRRLSGHELGRPAAGAGEAKEAAAHG
jgi:predicted MFS family arabinose efflux permease